MSLTKRRSTEALRMLCREVTTPQIPLPDLAAAAHLSPQTVGRFIRGNPLTPEQEDSVRGALLSLLPEGR